MNTRLNITVHPEHSTVYIVTASNEVIEVQVREPHKVAMAFTADRDTIIIRSALVESREQVVEMACRLRAVANPRPPPPLPPPRPDRPPNPPRNRQQPTGASVPTDSHNTPPALRETPVEMRESRDSNRVINNRQDTITTNRDLSISEIRSRTWQRQRRISSVR